MAKKETARAKKEHEAAAGRKYNRSEKHREAESRGMKKAMKKEDHSKKAAHHLAKAHEHLHRMHESAKEKYEHEAAAGRAYNRSAKHRRHESVGMKDAMAKLKK